MRSSVKRGRSSVTQRTDRIVFRAGPILDELQKRAAGGSPDLIAKRDLGRYYAMVRRAAKTLNFSRAEAELIRDALALRSFDALSFEFVWAAIDEEIRVRGLEAKFQVDGEALVRRLRELTPGQKLALVDAVERCLKNPDDAKALEESGLVRG